MALSRDTGRQERMTRGVREKLEAGDRLSYREKERERGNGL